ncbi:MAG: malto-oligosyltrehalose trehalohydrolase [Chryseolinea sp.]
MPKRSMMDVRINKRSIGVNFSSRGESEVMLWAPNAKDVSLVLTDHNQSIPLEKQERGYFTCITSGLKPGDRYVFQLDQKGRYPDPASLCQPDGIFGPSEVTNLHYRWTDHQWKNTPISDYIFYELHVGTFTTNGTFAAIEQKLDYLSSLGVTAIEIMPVAEFSGVRNWGYDGVFPFATHHIYGGPSGLQSLVNKCHEVGIAVVLDVVYNHMGPEGNYFEQYGPYFTDKYKTPWGSAINFDDVGSDEVRRYFIENVLMWFRDFHIDGLRLDAVHAIRDFGARHILQEIRTHVDQLMAETGRTHYLIAECDLNDPRFITGVSSGGYGMDAQWIDEFHHALRVAAGHDRNGYYADFNGILHLGKSFHDAYVYDGMYSPHRQKTFGLSANHISSNKFIVFSQNHDQVGNRMLGERTSVLTSFEMQKLAAATVILSPYLPFLFMGEEYGETNPFQYFVNHKDEDLIEAVRKGRKSEFMAFHHGENVPDPQSQQTFQQSKLQWGLINGGNHKILFEYYRELIRIRKKLPAKLLGARDTMSIKIHEHENVLFVKRWFEDAEVITIHNYSSKSHKVSGPFFLDGLQLIIDSSSTTWGGIQNAFPMEDVSIAPESFMLFTNANV